MSLEESKKGGGKKGGKRGVDNTSRRTWDTEEFEKKAKARAAQVSSWETVHEWEAFFRSNMCHLSQALLNACCASRMKKMMRRVHWMRRGEDAGVSKALGPSRSISMQILLSFALSAERDPLHQGLIVERANLKQREFQLDLTSRMNKSQVVTHNTPLSQQVRALLVK